MGVRQSKRSVDITETSTKGEIEGFGNEGKVEKIVDGVMEKVAINGHVESDLQNDEEAQQNGLEPVQNGEAATLAAEKVGVKDATNENAVEETANGQVETNGEVNGEIKEKAAEEESKKGEDKKEKKKKEKAVKKKFSLRNFSFSKKDKSKPTKETPEKVDETPAENATTNSAEKDESGKLQETTDVSKAEDSPAVMSLPSLTTVNEIVNQAADEVSKDLEVAKSVKEISEDLPPPLPVTPPPSETLDQTTTESLVKIPTGIVETLTEKVEEVTTSVSNALTEKLESTEEMLKDAEKIAIETGKQIEEKTTDILKTVEKRAEESLKAAVEKMEDVADVVENSLNFGEKADNADNAAKDTVVQAVEDTVSGESPEVKTEDAAEKNEETGAGESLAEVPKDLANSVMENATTADAGDEDSSEVAKTLPPPPPPVETTAE